jgi:nickel/cobalt transporter (NicO) family protein
MNLLVDVQHWLYGGMASGLGDVAGGDTYAIVAAMAAAVLFGAVHALMPGHGKTVLVSYHLGQPTKPTPQFETASGVLIALIGAFLLWRSLRSNHHAHTKDGKTLAFVTGMIPCPLTTFIMSYALARGMLAAGLEVTAAMTVGMIATIGGIALAAAFARERFMGLLDRTEGWRHRAGTVLEVGGSAMVLLFGLWMVFRSVAT